MSVIKQTQTKTKGMAFEEMFGEKTVITNVAPLATEEAVPVCGEEEKKDE